MKERKNNLCPHKRMKNRIIVIPSSSGFYPMSPTQKEKKKIGLPLPPINSLVLRSYHASLQREEVLAFELLVLTLSQ